MKLYKIDDQIVFADETLLTGTELAANMTDGAHEKHLPVVSVDGEYVEVRVGSIKHPSLEAHYIEFILLETDKGIQIKWLRPGNDPIATFKLVDGEKTVAVYEYCNLHGLWKTEV